MGISSIFASVFRYLFGKIPGTGGFVQSGGGGRCNQGSPDGEGQDEFTFTLTKDEFLSRIEQNDFIENATVYDNHYGVPRSPIVEGLAEGRDVIIKVDVKGAATLRRLIKNTISIFLAPESMEALLTRLRDRKTDDPDVLMKRFKTASTELNEVRKFDYVVFNEAGKLEDAVQRICEIVNVERAVSAR